MNLSPRVARVRVSLAFPLAVAMSIATLAAIAAVSACGGSADTKVNDYIGVVPDDTDPPRLGTNDADGGATQAR